jgi:hypothetical protein
MDVRGRAQALRAWTVVSFTFFSQNLSLPRKARVLLHNRRPDVLGSKARPQKATSKKIWALAHWPPSYEEGGRGSQFFQAALEEICRKIG